MAAQTEPARTPRQRWISILARASGNELEAVIARHGGVPQHAVLKAAEIGTVMIEARAGGTGHRFNAGEATMTRCVVRLSAGTIGFSYALGSDRRKALLAAVLDAQLQHSEISGQLAAEIERLADAQSAARDRASRKAAATKVEFFTLVRGND